MTNLRRRGLLLGAAALACLAPTARFAAAGVTNLPVPADLRHRVRAVLTEIFPDPAAPQALGRVYLERYPAEADVRHLMRDVLGDADPADARVLVRRLGERRTRDFRDGATVLVDGWVLARSEARLFALTVLM